VNIKGALSIPQKKIRVGIVGLGRVGTTRKEILEKHPAFSLAALCDTRAPDRKAGEDYAFFSDYADLLDAEIDAVFVATPNRISPEIVVAALERGKHVFCEKPPGRTVGDVQEIIKAKKKNPDRVLKFGFNHRYHGSVMEAKKIVESGRLGKILWMRGVYGKSGGIGFEKGWRSDPELAGGGILLDQGIHMLDLFRYFAGDFSEIRSFVNTSFWNIDLEDNAFALMRTKGGQVASLHSSSTQWKHTFLLDICLDSGYITLQGILSSTRSYGNGERLIVAERQFEDTACAVGNPAETITSFDQDRSWALEIDEFARCIRSGEPVKNGTSVDALQVMELVRKIYAGDPRIRGKTTQSRTQ